MNTAEEILGAHWVYRLFDAGGCLLYVGMTSDPDGRFQVWRSVARNATSHWFDSAVEARWEFFDSREGAADAERHAIQTEHPLHNVNMVRRPIELDRQLPPGASRRFTPAANERERRMVRAYAFDDMTLEQIGQRYGVTRERTRQLIERSDPTVYRLAKRRRKARARLRRYVNGTTARDSLHCKLCGALFMPTRRAAAFCSPVHYKVFRHILRYQIDENFRSTHRVTVAKWNLANGDERQRTYGERVLAGVAEERGRWLTQGSLAMHWAVRACSLGWPVFELFHPDVQAQVREAAGMETAA